MALYERLFAKQIAPLNFDYNEDENDKKALVSLILNQTYLISNLT
jgi:hypothetical protein